jgi:hypothetical protein
MAGGGEADARALADAVRASKADGVPIVVGVTGPVADHHSVQALAASLLDGVCLGLSQG